MGTLNEAQAMDIFTRYAVFIGDRDVLPLSRAFDLLGSDALEYIGGKHTLKRPLYGSYGVGKDGLIWYLTREGYLLAVTYNNIVQVQEERPHAGRQRKRQHAGEVVNLDAWRAGVHG